MINRLEKELSINDLNKVKFFIRFIKENDLYTRLNDAFMTKKSNDVYPTCYDYVIYFVKTQHTLMNIIGNMFWWDETKEGTKFWNEKNLILNVMYSTINFSKYDKKE